MSNNNQEKKLTTAFGIPVGDDQYTAGEQGPVLMQDVHLVGKLAHLYRELIPERVVHAKQVRVDTLRLTQSKKGELILEVSL